jgi:hypothetical protein
MIPVTNEGTQLKEDLWNFVFRLSHFKVSKKNHSFGFHMMTDGVSVSCLFKSKESPDETTPKPRKKKSKKQESPTKSLQIAKDSTIVGVDPGKHSILYMADGNSKRLQYTNVQRRSEMNTNRFQHNLHKLKMKEWQELEDKISQTNSRSPSLEDFQDYLKARFEVQDQLYLFYSDMRFRIYRWWSFQRKQKSESTLVRHIQKTFGSNLVLAYGTWNNPNQMNGLIPSPTCGMRKLLSRHFRVVDTCEYNTTKKCSLCETGWVEPVLKRNHPKLLKKGIIRSMDVRGLRRCNNEECAAYVNRDHNAACNIRSNLLHYIQHGTWHPTFSYVKPKENTNITT